MRKKLPFILLAIFMIAQSSLSADNNTIFSSTIDKTIRSVRAVSNMSDQLVERGVKQAAALWIESDGSQQDFQDFCRKNFCKNIEEKVTLSIASATISK